MALTISEAPVPLTTDAHGVVRVAGTRVTLDIVIAAFNAGATAEEIVLQFPSLSLAAVYAVLSFYLRQREEVDTYLRERERQAEAARKEARLRFPNAGIRERMLARQAPTGQ
jgi:uncharacterized protein (DUF433 family)